MTTTELELKLAYKRYTQSMEQCLKHDLDVMGHLTESKSGQRIENVHKSLYDSEVQWGAAKYWRAEYLRLSKYAMGGEVK